MDEQPSGGAPPVVAVVVTRDPGPWLEESLAALGSQDYPNLSVLVVDAASADDLTPRVAGVLPSAYVRRLDRAPGYAEAANEVLTEVTQPEPDRKNIRRALSSLKGLLAPLATGMATGAGEGVHEWAKTAIEQLGTPF